MKEKVKNIQFIYGLAFGITSFVLAVLLMLQVCDIYFNGGANPYTVSAIKEHFNRIVLVIVLWLVIAIAGFVLDKIFPVKEKSIRLDEGYILSNLTKKLEHKSVGESKRYEQLKKYRVFVNTLKCICGVCVGICSVFSFAYLCTGENFSNSDQNKEIVNAALYLLPFVVISFALCIGVVLFEKKMIKKQLPVVKGLLANAPKDGEKAEVKTKFFENKNTVASIRLLLAVIGVVLLVYGLATGGSAGVLAKAITICRQCIGLG